MGQKVYIAGFLKYLSLTGIFFMVRPAHQAYMAYVASREPNILHIKRQEKYRENAKWAFIYASAVTSSQPGLHLHLRPLRVPREEVGRRGNDTVASRNAVRDRRSKATEG